jgi:hypothetical protein
VKADVLHPIRPQHLRLKDMCRVLYCIPICTHGQELDDASGDYGS